MMDKPNPKDKQKIQAIATEDDRPVLMLNCNRYTLSSDFSSNDRYKKWRAVNEKMIEFVGGKILWSLPISGQILFTKTNEPLDEILAYWYPSHSSFLKLPESLHYTENFRLREGLINYAIIHRCSEHTLPFDA
jgi:hypothetical protein